MPANHVLAESLRFWMHKRGYEGQQAKLAKDSGVSQRTISNYLHPDRRLTGRKGKLPSAKLTEVELVAEVLDVAVWELLRGGSSALRDAYRETEELILRLGAGDRQHGTAETQPPASAKTGTRSRRGIQAPPPLIGEMPPPKGKRRKPP